MRSSIISASLCIPLIAGSLPVLGADCSVPPKPKTLFTCDAAKLRPTQPSIGLGEVAARTEKISKKSEAELAKYLQKHPAPVVKGPDDVLYIVDHHHLARILVDIGKSSKLQCGIVEDDSKMSAAELWKTLDAKCWAFLKDPKGQPIDPTAMPASVKDLRDDPYRTLAWRVVKKQGYCKTDTPFAEFKWAAFFRSQGLQPDELDRAMKAAESCGTAAEKLPGCKADGKACPTDDDDD